MFHSIPGTLRQQLFSLHFTTLQSCFRTASLDPTDSCELSHARYEMRRRAVRTVLLAVLQRFPTITAKPFNFWTAGF
jgi:hypothetical protein